MNKSLCSELQEKLEKQKISIESDLERFAKKGDWDTRFPKLDGGAGGQLLEDAADQVEEYVTLLPIEHSLELRLQNIDRALEKIKKGKYGICDQCKKKISEERLKAYPEAVLCTACQK